MWQLLYDKFAEFAPFAREIHFYDKEIDRMEASLFEMSPFPKHHEKRESK